MARFKYYKNFYLVALFSSMWTLFQCISGTIGLECYSCDDTKDEDFSCTDLLFDAKLHDCSDVFDAQYCIKTIGVYGGSLGTRRFCSSRDRGNYCEYIKRPGDEHLYRSCVFTCSSDACNPAVTLSPHLSIYTATFLFLWLITRFLFTLTINF